MEEVINKPFALEVSEGVTINTTEPTLAAIMLDQADSRYLRDLRVNLQNTLRSEHLSEQETALLGLAIAVNDKNETLISFFRKLAVEKGASIDALAEVAACASLLASNNVLYRFRHFTGKDKYNQLPARIKMNIMMKPVLGKEFFELVSLAVSAVNGCEMCVNSHEASVLELGATEERVFDAIRLASVVTSLNKVVH